VFGRKEGGQGEKGKGKKKKKEKKFLPGEQSRGGGSGLAELKQFSRKTPGKGPIALLVHATGKKKKNGVGKKEEKIRRRGRGVAAYKASRRVKERTFIRGGGGREYDNERT